MMPFKVTKHAAERLAQRALTIADAEMIVNFGTEVDGGYIFLKKDCVALEHELRRAVQQIQRLRGKRIVLEEGRLVTAYHATTATTQRLLKNGEERQMVINT